MEKSPERGLIIHFMDGSTVRISFPAQTEDHYKRKLMIEEILKNACS